jgi:hypothetical protein
MIEIPAFVIVMKKQFLAIEFKPQNNFLLLGPMLT